MRSLFIFMLMSMSFQGNLLAQKANDGWASRKQADALRDDCQYEKSVSLYDDAITMAKDDNERASHLQARARMWHQVGEYDKAIFDCESALKLVEFGVARITLGISWVKKGDPTKAIASFNKAFSPDEPSAHKSKDGTDDYNATVFAWRAVALSHIGDHEKALVDFDEALRLDPKSAFIYQRAAWFRATCPVGRYRNAAHALTCAKKASELSKAKSPLLFSTLAAAYAENGDFESAIKWQQEAINMKPCRFYGNEIETAKKCLDLYKAARVYRELPKN